MKVINYKSLGSVLWRILRNPLASELSYEEAAEYALEFIKLLGAPVAYADNISSNIEVVNHKAELPCNILTISGIKYLDVDEDGRFNRPIAMRESTDIYHFDPSEFANEGNTDFDLRGNHRRLEYTYSVQKGVLFTSIKDGYVTVAYRGIATDEDGYPLIPDNEKVMLGMEYYILSRYLEPMYLMGKVTDKAFEYIQQKRYFYMPSAFTALQMPSVDGMESVMNSINRLILSNTSHESFFKKSGEKERLRKFR